MEFGNSTLNMKKHEREERDRTTKSILITTATSSEQQQREIGDWRSNWH
jgi:hypothetical protein